MWGGGTARPTAVAAASDSASHVYPEVRRQLTESRVRGSLPELPGMGDFGCPRRCPLGRQLQEGKANKSLDISETGHHGDL